jgi:hypothetical protein
MVSSKKIIASQLILIIFVSTLFIVTVIKTENPKDYRPDKLSLPDRKGTITGYTFLDWEVLMANSSLAEEYMDLAALSLNTTYVHCQWSVVGKAGNGTLDLNYLGNLTLFIQGLANRSMNVLIYTWVSAYTPNWMFTHVPEVDSGYGESKTNWYGIDPATTDSSLQTQRIILKNSILHYYDLLTQYFIDKGLADHIIGFNLDDEMNIDPNSPNEECYWLDFYQEITALIHNKKDQWEVQAMMYNTNTYKLGGPAGFDVNSIDVFTQDLELIERIEYSYNVSGVEKISIILDAMFHHESQTDLDKLHRHAWIAWFMGCDQIGYYSFYYGYPFWSCAIVRFQDGLGPQLTVKTQLTFTIAQEISLLNQAYKKIQSTSNALTKGNLEEKLLNAYNHARANEFSQARILLEEVVQN